jgi:hypothetical protein
MSFTASILKFFGVLGEYFAAIFKSAINQQLKIVLPIATKAVKMVASDPSLLSGGAKREAAIASILAELAAKQVQVGVSTLNLAIELAYQKFLIDEPVKLESAKPEVTTEETK